MKEYIDRLRDGETLSRADLMTLLSERDAAVQDYAIEQAVQVRQRIYGRDIYIRGLVEISNYCKNGCYYCGIRSGNRRAATVSPPNRSWTAAGRAMNWDFAPSSCKAGRTAGSRTRDSRPSYGISRENTRTAPSPSPWANAPMRVTGGCTRPGRTDISCATRRPPRNITGSSTPKTSPSPTGRNVSGI